MEVLNWLGSNSWAVWLAIATILVVTEFFTTDLTALMIGLGFAAGSLGAWLWGDTAAIALALIVACLLFFLARPPLRRLMEGNSDRDLKMGFAGLVGTSVLAQGPDRVVLLGGPSAGDPWTARLGSHAHLLPGQTYTVLEVEGSSLLLTEKTFNTEGELPS